MASSARREHRPVLGVTYMLAGTVLFAATDGLGKWLTADYPVLQVAWVRSIIGMTLVGLFAVATGRTVQLKTTKPAGHAFRSMLSAVVTISLFFGLANLPLAEFVAIVFATPFVVALLSSRFLGEKVSRQTWIATIFGFIGILLVARPTPEHFQIAHLTTLLLTLALAFLIVTARRLNITESVLSLNFYLYPVTIIVAAWWAWQGWVAPTLVDWLLFLALAVVLTIALGCFLQAMRYANPALVAPIDYVRMVWTIMLGYFIWHEVPEPLTWAGIVIIVLSGVHVVSHSRAVPEMGVNVQPESRRDARPTAPDKPPR